MSDTADPELSVIIATRDRASLLEQTLTCLASQDLGTPYEVIVVENGCRDATVSVLERMREQLRLVVLHEPIPGKTRALNRALAQARGEWLVFTDDDVRPDRSWLRALRDGVKRWPRDSIFGGPITPLFPESAPSWIRDPEFFFASPAFSRYAPAHSEGPLEQAPFGPNLMIRRRLLAMLRFSEDFGPAGPDYVMGGETELLERLRMCSERFIYLPDAHVQHVICDEQLTRQWLSRRAFRFGRSRARLSQRRLGVRVLKVPLYLWARLGSALFRRGISVLLDESRQISAAIVLHKRRGLAYEYRNMARPASTRRKGEDGGGAEMDGASAPGSRIHGEPPT